MLLQHGSQHLREEGNRGWGEGGKGERKREGERKKGKGRDRERERRRNGGRSLLTSIEKILSSLRILICFSSTQHNIVVIISLDLHIIPTRLSDPLVCAVPSRNAAFSYL